PMSVEPDEADVNFATVTERERLQERKETNDALGAEAIPYLKKESVPANDIKATRLNVSPYKEYIRDKDPVPMFRAQQSINVKITDLERLTNLISGLADLGVNNIQNIEFKT